MQSPIAIRYPRGYGKSQHWKEDFSAIEIGSSVCLQKGKSIAILSIGTIANAVSDALQELTDSENFSHYDIRFLKPLDEEILIEIFNEHQRIITIEDGAKKGGLGAAILEFASEQNISKPITIIGLPDQFIEHGSIEILKKEVGLDAASLVEVLKKERALL